MRPLRPLVFVLIAILVTGCDHATKVLAASALSGGHVESVVLDVLSLERVHNTDTAFGLLASVLPLTSRLFLLKMTATLGVVFVVAFGIARFERASTVERLALAITLGGATGNAIDRWQWGYVVDFIHLEHWPVFNVADLALCVGVVMLGLSRRRATAR